MHYSSASVRSELTLSHATELLRPPTRADRTRRFLRTFRHVFAHPRQSSLSWSRCCRIDRSSCARQAQSRPQCPVAPCPAHARAAVLHGASSSISRPSAADAEAALPPQHGGQARLAAVGCNGRGGTARLAPQVAAHGQGDQDAAGRSLAVMAPRQTLCVDSVPSFRLSPLRADVVFPFRFHCFVFPRHPSLGCFERLSLTLTLNVLCALHSSGSALASGLCASRSPLPSVRSPRVSRLLSRVVSRWVLPLPWCALAICLALAPALWRSRQRGFRFRPSRDASRRTGLRMSSGTCL